MSRWPKDDQAALIAFYGTPATPALESQLVDVVPPFRMTYAGKPIRSIKFHKKAAAALSAALNEIWEAYGRDQAKIDAARVSVYSGAYNPRMIRGSTTKWSNHAYGAAIDIDAEHNGFNTGHGTMPKIVVDAFKRQGARWGGDYKGRTDPMHFEFCGEGEIVAPGATIPATPPVPPPQPVTAAVRRRMAKLIVDYEARKDAQGRLTVYTVPADKSKEVAGINERYHPDEFAKVSRMIAAGDYVGANAAVEDYIIAYTAPAAGWTTDAGVEFYLRDCLFNRGPHGAARILQRALGVADDGDIGPKTRAAMANVTPVDLLTKLRAAREKYERDVMNRNESDPRWVGLVNRWNKALIDARKINDGVVQPSAVSKTAPAPISAKNVVATVIVASGGTGAAVAHSSCASLSTVIAIAVIAVALAALAWVFIHRKKG